MVTGPVSSKRGKEKNTGSLTAANPESEKICI